MVRLDNGLGEGMKTVCVMCCLRVSPDMEFGFGFGVPESGVGLDGASVSGLLRRLDFCVRYLAIAINTMG